MTPRRELVWIHDIAGSQVDAIGHGFFDLWSDDRLDQSETLGFEIAASNPKAYRLAPDIEIVHRFRRYYIAEIEQRRRGTTTTISVEANATWYRLGHRKFVGSFVVDLATPAAGLAAILDGTGWAVGTNTTSSTDTFTMERQDISRLSLLRQWAKVTGRAVVFNTFSKTVDLVDSRGTDRGLAFRYGRNITGVRRRVRPPEVTRLYPFGADSLSIAGINGEAFVENLDYYTSQGLTADEAAEMYGRDDIYSDSAFVKDSTLLAAAQLRIASEGGEQITYELDVVDLSEITTLNEDTRTGDTVGVYDPDFGEEVRPIVTRYRNHRLQPWRNKIELSTIPDVIGDGSSSSRPSSSAEWRQFVGPIRANFEVRNDATWTVARIPLRFTEGGKYHTSLDLTMSGVGAGVVTVEIYDATNDLTVREWSENYTDAGTVRVFGSHAFDSLDGSRDYRLRVSVAGDGGADPDNGVDLVFEDEETDRLSWWVMVKGAVQETPPLGANSQTFSVLAAFPAGVQEFVVPDNVEEITVVAQGAGGNANGGTVQASFPVTSGETLFVLVGESGPNGGFPNGGLGYGPVGNQRPSAGGASIVTRNYPGTKAKADLQTLTPTDLLVVAPAGGSGGASGGTAGAGGFFRGVDGADNGGDGGDGATQFGPGVYGNESGEYMIGAGNGGGSSASQDYGGAGGGGYYGGASGFASSFSGGGGGGGGSGYVNPAAFDLLVQDAVNNGNGQVVISWETPDI